jgi:hypothetical protein
MFGRLFFTTMLLTLCVGSAAFAQSKDNSPAQSTPNSGSPASSDSSAATPSQKKVWTNEDLAGVKGGVSVVGNKRNQTLHPSSGQPADAATVDRIKKSLQKLQSQLDEVNAKLDSYKQFQNGEAVSTGERDTSKGYSRTPVDQQMNQLLSKKKDLTGQMSDLLDEARKKGIDPGLLR